MLDSKTYVDKAEKVIQGLIVTETWKNGDKKRNKSKEVTTNQVRNILSLITELYDMVRNQPEKEIADNVVSHIQYVRMRIVYSAGRDEKVKKFVDQSGLLDHLKEIGSSRDNLLLVCRYMEALVAYHKFYGLGSEK